MGKDDGLVGFIILALGAIALGKIFSDISKKAPYKCPRCSGQVLKNQNPCPGCGSPLRWT